MPFIDSPGISIVAFDPGVTTGVAVWDAYTGELYVDQIDAGRGRKVRLHVWPNKTESIVKNRVKKQMKAEVEGKKVRGRDGRGLGVAAGSGAVDPDAGVMGRIEMMHRIEAGVVQIMTDIVMAAGPRTIVVVEDFILGWGDPHKVTSAKREGVSPLRLISRFRQKAEDSGLLNGDAWRTWDGFGIGGEDGRGIKAVRASLCEPMDFQQRLTDVEMWRLGDLREAVDAEGHVLREGDRALWAGGGIKWVQQQPSSRIWLRDSGGVRGVSGRERMMDWLREQGQYRGTCPHGMDALLHAHVVARSLGSAIPGKPRRIWTPVVSGQLNRVSPKAAIPAHRAQGV